MIHAASARAYLLGFLFAAILTIIPFWAVIASGWTRGMIDGTIAASAIGQVVVQMRYFMHLRLRQSTLPTLLALGFAVFLIAIMIGGSLWIMSDLNMRMMGM